MDIGDGICEVQCEKKRCLKLKNHGNKKYIKRWSMRGALMKDLVRELEKRAHFSGNKDKLRKVLGDNPRLIHLLMAKIKSGKRFNEIIRLFGDEGHLETMDKDGKVWIKYIPKSKGINFLSNFREEIKDVFEGEEFEPRVHNVQHRRNLTELGLSDEVVKQINAMIEEESIDI